MSTPGTAVRVRILLFAQVRVAIGTSALDLTVEGTAADAHAAGGAAADGPNVPATAADAHAVGGAAADGPNVPATAADAHAVGGAAKESPAGGGTAGDTPTVGEALAALLWMHPQLAPHLPSCRVAVGVDYVSLDQRLQDGDEVSLIPPVQGG